MNKKEEKQPVAIQNFVRGIVVHAQFSRLLNLLQDNGDRYVDKTKYVNIEGLRNLLYWDLFEYLTNQEWGDSIEDRLKEMKKPAEDVGR